MKNRNNLPLLVYEISIQRILDPVLFVHCYGKN
jgi:hypothetical protein